MAGVRWRGVRVGLRGPERWDPGSGKGAASRYAAAAPAEVRLALESGSFPRAPPAATSPWAAANRRLGCRGGAGPPTASQVSPAGVPEAPGQRP